MAQSPRSPKSPRGPHTPRISDTVVIAMDGSEYSDYALQFYMESLHKPEDKIIIAHAAEYKIISSPAVAIMTGNPAMVTEEFASVEREADALVEKLTNKMKTLHITAQIERIHGEAGPAVCTLANNMHADYIVIGCRGKGTVRRTFTGSVTDYVTHHSHVPVLIARHKDHVKHYHGIHIPNPFHHKKHSEDNSTTSHHRQCDHDNSTTKR